MVKRFAFNGAVVLITGAGQGIGLALVKGVIRRGGVPIAVDQDAGLIAKLEQELGEKARTHVADVTNAQAMAGIVAATLTEFGRLDCVIANAGIERIDPVWQMPTEEFEAVLEVNILGVYRTLKPALDPIIQSGGHILAVSSIAGVIPFPLGMAYSTSKSAVDMMMRVLRLELMGTGATAGAAYFGFIQTAMGERVTGHPGVSTLSRFLPRRLLGLAPILPADAAARAVLDGIERRRARIYAPRLVGLTYLMRGFMAMSDDFLGRRVMRLPQFITSEYGSPKREDPARSDQHETQ